MNVLCIATSNHGKLEELRLLLADLPVEIVSMEQALAHPPVVVEDGKTFEDNSVKKACQIAAATMMLTVADDSGLEVDALDGAPGVRSARYASERATDAENNAALLSALDALAESSVDGHDLTREHAFRARFRCVLAVVDPYSNNGEPRTVEGTCEGAITRMPRGSGGFGYDPLFLVEGTNKTMAELTAAEKNAVSHRARACLALKPVLEELLSNRARTIDAIARTP